MAVDIWCAYERDFFFFRNELFDTFEHVQRNYCVPFILCKVLVYSSSFVYLMAKNQINFLQQQKKEEIVSCADRRDVKKNSSQSPCDQFLCF